MLPRPMRVSDAVAAGYISGLLQRRRLGAAELPAHPQRDRVGRHIEAGVVVRDRAPDAANNGARRLEVAAEVVVAIVDAHRPVLGDGPIHAAADIPAIVASIAPLDDGGG